MKKLFFIIKQKVYCFINGKNYDTNSKVLMFHKIDDSGDIYSISKKNFEQLIKKVEEKSCEITTLESIKNKSTKSKYVFTFYDAYESIYNNAYPILKAFNLPYYVFVNLELLGKDNYLKKEQIQEMIVKSKCILGSHGEKHVVMRFEDVQAYKNNIKHSKIKLEEIFKIKITSFAFPYGSMYACSKENIDYAMENYENVLNTYGIAYKETYKNYIPRIIINDRNFNEVVL